MLLKEAKAGTKLVAQPVILRLHKTGTSSNGGVYARGIVEDNSGQMNFICFDRDTVSRLRELDGPQAFVVSGSVDPSKYAPDGGLQVNVIKLERATEHDDLTNLLPAGRFDTEVYRKRFLRILGSVRTPSLKRLLEAIFDQATLEAFYRNPAGTRMHHAYTGGLLQHTVEVAELAEGIALKTPHCDLDIIIAGALLHDIGKLREISAQIGFPYTDEGRLLGHIAIAALLVRQTADKLRLPENIITPLLHVILAHHGEPDKGSPVSCATREAVIVHYADELSAVLNQFDHPEAKSNWEFNNMLKRFIMVGRKPE